MCPAMLMRCRVVVPGRGSSERTWPRATDAVTDKPCDADNAQSTVVEDLLAEVARYGTAHVKRAYGDWTASRLNGWKQRLLTQSVQPIQQFAHTTGQRGTRRPSRSTRTNGSATSRSTSGP